MPTHREEVAERDVREDLVGSVPGALTLALSPELLQSFQQGARGAEEKGILLGDGVIQRRVIAMTAQPARQQTAFTGRHNVRTLSQRGEGSHAEAPPRCDQRCPRRTNPPPAPSVRLSAPGACVATEQLRVPTTFV